MQPSFPDFEGCTRWRLCGAAYPKLHCSPTFSPGQRGREGGDSDWEETGVARENRQRKARVGIEPTACLLSGNSVSH